MFEKEAEEWANKMYPCDGQAQRYLLEGAKFGYKKANEWYFVKDGDLPKKTDEYLVYKISGYGVESIELILYNSSKHFWCVDCQNDVIAWKEIVLPKESE